MIEQSLQTPTITMLKLAIAALLASIPCTAAFSPAIRPVSLRASPTTLLFHPETFDRAVKCATNFGTCDLDELEKLALGE